MALSATMAWMLKSIEGSGIDFLPWQGGVKVIFTRETPEPIVKYATAFFGRFPFHLYIALLDQSEYLAEIETRYAYMQGVSRPDGRGRHDPWLTCLN